MTRRLIVALTVGALSIATGCAAMRAVSRDFQVDRSADKVARGEYLVNSVMACMACHTVLGKESHMPELDKLGAGGRLFGKEEGLPGNIYSSNITPDPETGLGNWTDDEILRAMREGISKNGQALFPMMPYLAYHEMGDEDAHAVVAYLRTIKPVKNKVPARELDFPLGMLVNTMPKPLSKPVQAPGMEDPVARGRYILSMASCTDCHTPRKGPDLDMERWLAGGGEFPENGKKIKIPNLTPDKETGLGNWTDEQIEMAIRFGQRPDGRQLHPVMPWPYYNGMNDADMKALIAYLRSVKPVPSK